MNESEFWLLISDIDVPALDAGDEDTAMEKITSKLSQMSVSSIGDFQKFVSGYLYKLDGRAWCNEAGQSMNSDDGYLYARCYVVASGKEHYERVLSDPREMPKSLDYWAESLLFVATNAWSVATGRDEEEFDLFSSISYETGSNDAQW